MKFAAICATGASFAAMQVQALVNGTPSFNDATYLAKSAADKQAQIWDAITANTTAAGWYS